ncbi:MAG: glycerophosphodiester phosphodiesterase family protein, partial [Gemmatimonadota bacterium]
MNLLLDRSAHPVIGHRGAAWYAPENTLESFRLALSQGADAIEFDVRRSADGEAMVFHDPTLDRTTDQPGPIAARTAAELKRLDAGFHYSQPGMPGTPFRGVGVRIPTLREVIAAFPELPLLIEVKEPEVAEATARALVEGAATDRAVIA